MVKVKDGVVGETLVSLHFERKLIHFFSFLKEGIRII
jgi:hypothetical protein